MPLKQKNLKNYNNNNNNNNKIKNDNNNNNFNNDNNNVFRQQAKRGDMVVVGNGNS